MLPTRRQAHEAPEPGEIFHQPELAATLRKLVEAEQQGAAAQARTARRRSTRPTTASTTATSRTSWCAVREQGGLFTMEDLAHWKVKIEEPVHTNYKGIEVYKLTTWVQGPVMLQALNILENFDLKAMGYDSARYIHTLYQAMNLAFADRDFYYGDPAFSPATPIKGLLSKDYARERARLINPDHNDPDMRPGDPYPFQNGTNPFPTILAGVAQQDAGAAPRLSAWPRSDRHVPAWDDECRGGGREGLGRVGHAERRLDPGGHRGAHRHRPVAAHAELRARRERESVQRARSPASARARRSRRRWR